MNKSELLKGIIDYFIESIIDTDNGEDLEELKELMKTYDNLNDIIENMYINNIFKQQLMRIEDLL